MPIRFTCKSCGKILQAPDDMAGKQSRCPQCQTILPVPHETSAGESAGSPPVEEPGYRIQDPAVPGPPSRPRDLEPRRRSEADPDEDREPCPVCGEMIKPNAAKCRYCGEIFDEELRKEAKKGQVADVDRDMATIDWVLAVLCSGIGCVFGIVYLIQGKPKGAKMLGVSFLFCVLWQIVNMAIQSAMQQRRF